MSEEQSEQEKPKNIGRIEWLDLTVNDASRVRDYYNSVEGWNSEDEDN
ncbi:MAG: hypothetical protein RL120_10930 [Gammaproteobacteria bacterium]